MVEGTGSDLERNGEGLSGTGGEWRLVVEGTGGEWVGGRGPHMLWRGLEKSGVDWR